MALRGRHTPVRNTPDRGTVAHAARSTKRCSIRVVAASGCCIDISKSGTSRLLCRSLSRLVVLRAVGSWCARGRTNFAAQRHWLWVFLRSAHTHAAPPRRPETKLFLGVVLLSSKRQLVHIPHQTGDAQRNQVPTGCVGGRECTVFNATGQCRDGWPKQHATRQSNKSKKEAAVPRRKRQGEGAAAGVGILKGITGVHNPVVWASAKNQVGQSSKRGARHQLARASNNAPGESKQSWQFGFWRYNICYMFPTKTCHDCPDSFAVARSL
jgi:hypothetical protein